MKQIELDDKTYQLAEKLAGNLDVSIAELISRLLSQQVGQGPNLLGLLADEPELMDEVMESVHQARETHPLRQAG
ncbi:MAG TPA: hypothetical protein V6D23_14130 [Candidatus Obscuribacterales bacterium]